MYCLLTSNCRHVKCSESIASLSPPPLLFPSYTHQVYCLQAQVDLALADLDRAIQLSGGRGRAAEQAYTQRGLVWRLRGEDERALEDFKSAARLGSHFAQKQVMLCVGG